MAALTILLPNNASSHRYIYAGVFCPSDYWHREEIKSDRTGALGYMDMERNTRLHLHLIQMVIKAFHSVVSNVYMQRMTHNI
jgi:hypothetical protein